MSSSEFKDTEFKPNDYNQTMSDDDEVKDDEVKKCEDWKAKGADINYINDKGHSAVHVAAAFGALNVLRYLHKQGASFETINAVSLTP